MKSSVEIVNKNLQCSSVNLIEEYLIIIVIYTCHVR